MSKIDELENRFKDVKSVYQEKKGALKTHQTTLDDLVDKEDALDDKIVKHNDIAELLRNLSVEMKENLKEMIEGLTTKALRSIWQEEDVSFILEFEEKRGQIETDFIIEYEGMEVRDILNTCGGGMADVVSFMLRVVVHQFYSPSLPDVLILDEPFKHVRGEQYINRLGEFIQEISDELDFQMIITSHQKDLLPYSDKLFEVSLKSDNDDVPHSVVSIEGDDNDS
jgi:DNA repair exonuclease SbcCD ATPase subunit